MHNSASREGVLPFEVSRLAGHELSLALHAVLFEGDFENLRVVEPVYATGQRLEAVSPSRAAGALQESSVVLLLPGLVLDGHGYVHGSCTWLGGSRWQSQAHP